MITLVLEDVQADVLMFILDTTIEQWASQQEGQLGLIADDPMFTSWEALQEAAGTLVDLTTTAKRIREKFST
jgi:hypothetical protein